MTLSNKVNDAAQALCRHRLAPQKTDPLAPLLRPTDETEAYAMQDALHGQLQGAGLGAVAGYKIGCTTPVMQKFLNIDHPCAGGIMQRRLFEGTTEHEHASFSRVGVECEIAVCLGRSISGRLSHDELLAAITEYRVSLEVVDDRYHDYRQLDAATLIADDFFQSACVLGADGVSELPTLGTLEATMRINNSVVGEGVSSDILGHPLNALAWLCEHLEARGKALERDQWVSLGSMVETQWLSAGDAVDIEVSNLGSLRYRVA